MSITRITEHTHQALKRLVTQYREKPNFEAIVSTFSYQIQELEDAFFQLLESRSIDTSIGLQLDNLGSIVDEKREGLSDNDYRLKLIAKIAVNTSQGTPEDLINIFKIFMQADRVAFFEYFPATIQLVAQDAQPISSIQRIKDALNRTKPAGIAFDSLILVNASPPFCFAEAADLECKGFRDLNHLLETLNPFELRDIGNLDSLSGRFDDLTNPGSGGDFSMIIETDASETLDPNSGFFSEVI